MHRRGFTLIELALVMAVMGALVALAAPSYQGLLYRTRAEEPRAILAFIAHAELTYFRDHGTYLACPPSIDGPPPRGLAVSFDNARPGWRELGVHIEGGAVRYRYEVRLQDGSFVAIANGDLNGNGVMSTFRLNGADLQLTVEQELE